MKLNLLYIDPSAVNYIIQVIAGVLIAGGAALGFYWRRIRRYFRKKKEERLESKVQGGPEDGVH